MVAPSDPPKPPLPGQRETLMPAFSPAGGAPPLPTPRPSRATDVTLPALPSDAPAPADAPALTPVTLVPLPETAPTLQIPRSFGNYEIIDELARGGMGVVYRARQVGLDRLVALKIMLEGEFAARDAVERFHREARAVARLQHAAIVPIHDIGAVDGRPFFTMELVEGPSFDAWFKQQKPTPRTILEVVRQVADAVAYAHAQGVIHRDLKPANILIDPAGRPHLLDFGLARDLHDAGSRTRTGLTFGTPAYMPPEQAAGHVHQIDEKSDIYSLGAILFHAFAGRPPFDGENAASVLQAVIASEPPRPRSLCPDLHREIEVIIRKAMAREKRDRYARAADLAEDLARFLDGRPILARPPGLVERGGRYVRRHRTAVAACALAAAVAAVAAWHFLDRLRLERDLERQVANADALFREAFALPPERAGLAEWRGKVEAAVRALDAVARRDPMRASVLRERGFARESAGDLTGAAQDFADAAVRDPRLADASYHHARLLLRLGGPRAEEGRRALQAVAEGKGPLATVAQARLGLADRDPFRTVTLARQAVESEAARRAAYPILASAYLDWGYYFDQPRALRELEQAIALLPSDGDLYLARARINLLLLRRPEALADCRFAAARVASPELDLLEEDALYANGRFKEALAKATEVTTRAPDQVEMQARRGKMLLLARREDEARKILTQLLARGTIPALTAALDLATATRDPGFGLGAVESAAAALPSRFETLAEGVALAHLHLLLRNAARVQEITEELVRRYPDRPEALLTRGELASAEGRVKDLKKTLGQVIQLAPEWSELYRVRAALNQTPLQWKDALPDLDRVLRLAPANFQARMHRGVLRLLLQDKNGAVDDFVELTLLGNYLEVESVMLQFQAQAKGTGGNLFLGMLRSMVPAMLVEVADRLYRRGEAAREANDLAAARKALTLAVLVQPRRNEARIGLARTYAQLEDYGAALEFLERAEGEGYRDADALEAMPELAPLQITQRFQATAKRMREAAAKEGK